MVRRLLFACVFLLLMPGVARAAPLTNTAHLDFLSATVAPPPQAGHSTFGSGPIGVLWTYADRNADGSYRRVGVNKPAALLCTLCVYMVNDRRAQSFVARISAARFIIG